MIRPTLPWVCLNDPSNDTSDVQLCLSIAYYPGLMVLIFLYFFDVLRDFYFIGRNVAVTTLGLRIIALVVLGGTLLLLLALLFFFTWVHS